MSIKFEAKLKAGIKWDDAAKVFVTYAPALGLYSQGSTKIQAKTALIDAINSFLVVAYQKNVLHAIMHACGCVEHNGHPDELRQSGNEYILIEEQVLEQQQYEDVFEVPAQLALAA